jgi:hypothetical protein
MNGLGGHTMASITFSDGHPLVTIQLSGDIGDKRKFSDWPLRVETPLVCC